MKAIRNTFAATALTGLFLQAYGCAPAPIKPFPTTEEELFRHEVDWETTEPFSACGLISRAEAEKALGQRATKPVVTTPVLLTGFVHSEEWGICEFATNEKAVVAEKEVPKVRITLQAFFTPFKEGDWPKYFRENSCCVTDISGIAPTAYWAKISPGYDRLDRLYAFDAALHIAVEVDGIAQDKIRIERAILIAKAALARWRKDVTAHPYSAAAAARGL